MKIGPLELLLSQQGDGTWKYDILKHGEPLTHGFRPTEQKAREAGWEDAELCRSFVRES